MKKNRQYVKIALLTPLYNKLDEFGYYLMSLFRYQGSSIEINGLGFSEEIPSEIKASVKILT